MLLTKLPWCLTTNLLLQLRHRLLIPIVTLVLRHSLFLINAFSAGRDSCSEKTSTCTRGTGGFAAWSAGASRYSWTRKRVCRERFVLWPPWKAPHRLLRRPRHPLRLRRRLLLRVIGKDPETEPVAVGLPTEREWKRNYLLSLWRHRKRSFCLSKLMILVCNFSFTMLSICENLSWVLPSMKPKCPFKLF